MRPSFGGLCREKIIRGNEAAGLPHDSQHRLLVLGDTAVAIAGHSSLARTDQGGKSGLGDLVGREVFSELHATEDTRLVSERKPFYTEPDLDSDRIVQYHYGMNRLLQLRTKAGLTQAELARRVGTAQPNIARAELQPDNPNYRKIPPQLYRPLAKVLGVSVYDLTGSLDAMTEGVSAAEKARIARIIEAALPNKE